MQRTIYLLSDETINQIAAGEVIESPASVVKELVENALDAGACKITIEVTGGGLKLIRVVDDGKGMHAADAHLSILRHATSKITRPQDLFHISTKGFRGEALASIASISKMELITAWEGNAGIRLEIEKGEILKEKPCARTHGTTIEVRSLFYNVPARKKFQKTAAALSAEIFRIVTVMSLSHPEVQFELVSNNRKVIKTRGEESLASRAEALLGEEFIAGSFPLEFEEEGLHFSGLIGAPTNTRNNKVNQFLFLNRRAVVCPEISEAVRDGYGTRLDEKRHPLFLLHLDIPPDLVDVNVHPQKLHVRLRDEVSLRDKMQRAVEKAFAKLPEKKAKAAAAHYSFDAIKTEYVAPLLREEVFAVEQQLLLEKEAVDVMGAMGAYLFLREEEEVIVVDLQAAHSRIIFEKLLEKDGIGREKQGLLVPLVIELTPVELAMVLTHLDAIEEVGFALHLVNEKELSVDAIPSFVREADVKSMIVDMANHLQEYIGKGDYVKMRQRKLAQIASRFAKAKSSYSKEEGKQLFEQLRSCASPLQCPKGNTTMVYLDHDAIEKLFRENQKTAKSTAS